MPSPRQPNPLSPKTTKAERDAVDTKIVDYLSTAPGSRTAEIARGTSLTPREIDRSLQRLRTAGKIEQRDGYGHWHVTGARNA